MVKIRRLKENPTLLRRNRAKLAMRIAETSNREHNNNASRHGASSGGLGFIRIRTWSTGDRGDPEDDAIAQEAEGNGPPAARGD